MNPPSPKTKDYEWVLKGGHHLIYRSDPAKTSRASSIMPGPPHTNHAHHRAEVTEVQG
jgi:hypothetical protein